MLKESLEYLNYYQTTWNTVLIK